MLNDPSDRRVLTEEQQRVVDHRGNGVVVACPGSGKTRSLSVRLATRIADWHNPRSGLAALSFTNVAADELAAGLRRFGILAMGHQHFVGTINSFVYRHLIAPFGAHHLGFAGGQLQHVLEDDWVCGCPCFCVKLWVRTQSKHYPTMVPVTRFHYYPDGGFWYKPVPGAAEPRVSDVTRAKAALHKAGYISPSDAVFYAIGILRAYPVIAAALGVRFPLVAVDEAQDSSLLQQAFLTELARSGNCEVMLVGDPLQSIYEFQDANPAGMLSHVSKDGWAKIILRDNFRSSRNICKAVQDFFGTPITMSACGSSADCHLPPIVLRYPDAEIGALADAFHRLLSKIPESCGRSSARIVARSHRAVLELRRLAGQEYPHLNPVTQRMLDAAIHYAEGRGSDSMATLERGLCLVCWGRESLDSSRSLLGDFTYRRWREQIWALAAALPSPDLELVAWIPQARLVVKDALREMPFAAGAKFSSLRKPSACPPISARFASEVTGSGSPIPIETVHKVKGLSLDALMLVGSPKLHPKAKKSSVHQWVGSDGIDLSEEQRIAYVAMTRPRRLLVVAVPDSAWASCGQAFQAFHEIPLAACTSAELVCARCNACPPVALPPSAAPEAEFHGLRKSPSFRKGIQG